MKFIGFAFFLLFSILTVSCGGKSAGDVVADFIISDQQEIQMGANYAAYIDSSSEYPLMSKNSKISKYVDSIGHVIINANKNKPGFRNPDPQIGFDYTFHVIDKPIINAFAVPGGYVYVYKGLIDSLNNEAELVGVMGHEIGHVVKKHSKKQLIENFATEAITSMILGDKSLIGKGISTIAGLSRSRKDEYEADSCGVVYSVTAGYNPYAMVSFFNVLLGLSGENSLSDILVYVQTHPLTSDRIAAVKSHIERKFPQFSPSDTTLLKKANFMKYVR